MQSKLRTIGIIAKSSIHERKEYVHQLLRALSNYPVKLLYDKNIAAIASRGAAVMKSVLLAKCDLVIVLGGDGTILKTARYAARHASLIASVNLGTLGFLTEFSPKGLLANLSKIMQNQFHIDERMLLRVTVYRGGKKHHTALALNDAVINQGGFARLITLRVEVNQRLLGRFHADGLIVSTATGSTGHSLSAGGPIVHPRLPCIVLTPICPVKLSMRPIVIPSDRQITIRVETEWKVEKKPIVLTLDGQTTLNLRKDDIIRIRKSSRAISMIRMRAHNYYPVLQRKLRWGE